jgi:sulfatase maturation enzyme AslB (radical SAM superfamily)
MVHKKTLYLVVTEKCNLSCDYCLYKKKDTIISLDTAMKGVGLFLDFNRDEKITKEIYLFGGEPLLYPSLTKKILLEMCTKYPDLINKGVLKIKILTNGALLNRNFYDFMIKLTNQFTSPFLEFTISFDGSIKTQDLHRGCGENIAYKIRQIVGYGENTSGTKLILGIAWTLTPDGLNSFYSDFLFLFEKLKIQNSFSYLGIRLADLSRDLNVRGWIEGDIPFIQEGTNKIMDYYIKNLLNNNLVIHPINLIHDLKQKDIQKIHDEYNCINIFNERCDLGENITLLPDGRITACCIGRFLDPIFYENNPLVLCDVNKENFEKTFRVNVGKVGHLNIHSSIEGKNVTEGGYGDILKCSNKMCFLLFKKKEISIKNEVERAYLNIISGALK